MSHTLVGPATVVTLAEGGIVQNAGVAIAADRIDAVGEWSDLVARYPGARRLEAGQGMILPGLINAHAHFYGLFARGLALKDPPPQTFRQVLERLWWRLDKALDHRGVYSSALVAGIAAIRAGCTTVIDHHASPRAIPGSLDQIEAAMDLLGLRACLCYEVSDRDGSEAAERGIRENVRFIERVLSRPNGRIRAKFGLHASFTLSPETLREARQAESAYGTGFHIHCAEGPEDGAHSRARFGKRVVERLLDEGILGPRSIVAHCVHVDEHEIGLLAETGTTVTHQPQSNMGNAVGWARFLRMKERGVPVALGTDGYGWDMVESMRTAALLHSHMSGHPGTGVGEFARVLLEDNARLASNIFGLPVGRLEPGAAADLIVLDYYPPTPLTPENLPWHLQFGITAGLVRTVVVAGRAVMVDRRVVGLDEVEVAAEARKVAEATWERF